MNPNRSGESPVDFELPSQAPSPEGENQRQEKAVEAPTAPQEKAGNKPAAPALPAVPDDIPTADTPVIPAADDDAADSFDPHQQAKESDRIEPEWVDKAKAVISQTKDDPYKQKNEMSKIKADYIQKRFNKQIKTDEAAA
jgi:hypothetical protein